MRKGGIRLVCQNSINTVVFLHGLIVVVLLERFVLIMPKLNISIMQATRKAMFLILSLPSKFVEVILTQYLLVYTTA